MTSEKFGNFGNRRSIGYLGHDDTNAETTSEKNTHTVRCVFSEVGAGAVAGPRKLVHDL
jgi:hypothetical protein